MFSENTIFFILKKKNCFLIIKRIFLKIKNKKLFLKAITKQTLTLFKILIHLLHVVI